MTYHGISVRNVLRKINAPFDKGWFLPEVQRQYVWGARYEWEDYVCLLFDSLLKGYPIGGVVLWETEARVPFRHFLENYAPGKYAELVDEGRWGQGKSLVYDGQQRLQTIYSTLLHQINDRILHFNLLFDSKGKEAEDTGFLFFTPEDTPESGHLRMTDLASMDDSEQAMQTLEARVLPAAEGDNEKETLIKNNLTRLWQIFVNEEYKSIDYFSVTAEKPDEVNEIFTRLNTGGVALTQLELVLSKIKAVKSKYEEQLRELSKDLNGRSAGIEFTPASILQFFYLQVKRTIRIDASQVEPGDIANFEQALRNDSDALKELFGGYLSGLFKITDASIIPRWTAVLPIADYLAARKRGKHEWRITNLGAEIGPINRYFLLSQFCDWNTQTMVNQFAKLTREAGEAGRSFPIEEISAVAKTKHRKVTLEEEQLCSEVWFAAKVLMPTRHYIFHDRKPQIDHIFPLALQKDVTYRDNVDVLWNFQPTRAEINRLKWDKHPRDFFQSEAGSEYLKDYDFLPSSLDSHEWEDYGIFIASRKARMLEKLGEYGLELIHSPSA